MHSRPSPESCRVLLVQLQLFSFSLLASGFGFVGAARDIDTGGADLELPRSVRSEATIDVVL